MLRRLYVSVQVTPARTASQPGKGFEVQEAQQRCKYHMLIPSSMCVANKLSTLSSLSWCRQQCCKDSLNGLGILRKAERRLLCCPQSLYQQRNVQSFGPILIAMRRDRRDIQDVWLQKPRISTLLSAVTTEVLSTVQVICTIELTHSKCKTTNWSPGSADSC